MFARVLVFLLFKFRPGLGDRLLGDDEDHVYDGVEACL